MLYMLTLSSHSEGIEKKNVVVLKSFPTNTHFPKKMLNNDASYFRVFNGP